MRAFVLLLTLCADVLLAGNGYGGRINVTNASRYTIDVGYAAEFFPLYTHYIHTMPEEVTLPPGYYYDYGYNRGAEDTYIVIPAHLYPADEGFQSWKVHTQASKTNECIYWGKIETGGSLYENKEGLECLGLRTDEIVAYRDKIRSELPEKIRVRKQYIKKMLARDLAQAQNAALRNKINNFKSFFLNTYGLDFCEHESLHVILSYEYSDYCIGAYRGTLPSMGRIH